MVNVGVTGHLFFVQLMFMCICVEDVLRSLQLNEMADLKGRRICVKFCFNLAKRATDA